MSKRKWSRREWLRIGARTACLAGLGTLSWRLLVAGEGGDVVWQIDPQKCTACGKCATSCVRGQSAARCYQEYSVCGYCDLCSAFLELDHTARNSAAENALCPTGALQRRFIEEPYYEYAVERRLCIACGRCVKRCRDYGNGSLFLQIDGVECKQCNECSIARDCPAQAISRYQPDQEQPWLES
jgi:electron transport complex protein RnfB